MYMYPLSSMTNSKLFILIIIIIIITTSKWGQPLTFGSKVTFIPICRCRCTSDWACSRFKFHDKELHVTSLVALEYMSL